MLSFLICINYTLMHTMKICLAMKQVNVKHLWTGRSLHNIGKQCNACCSNLFFLVSETIDESILYWWKNQIFNWESICNTIYIQQWWEDDVTSATVVSMTLLIFHWTERTKYIVLHSLQHTYIQHSSQQTILERNRQNLSTCYNQTRAWSIINSIDKMGLIKWHYPLSSSKHHSLKKYNQTNIISCIILLEVLLQFRATLHHGAYLRDHWT